MYATFSQCAQHMYLLKLLRHQDMWRTVVLSHTLLLYLIFYMLYQRGTDFCLLSLQIRSVPFLGTSSDWLHDLQHYGLV